MSVQSIFKVLIGTMFLIVFSSLIVEIFNLSIVMHQMRASVQTALTKSCDLFAQETYKKDSTSNGTAGAGDLSNILTSDNSLYVSGNIYEKDTPGEIWKELYGPDSSFSSFLNTSALKSSGKYKWTSLELLEIATTNSYDIFLDAGLPLNPTEEQINNYNKYAFAKAYAENYYTPLNVGITYLDKATLEKIFQWNLTKLLTNGNSERIVKDESGNYYVQYNGFRCYANKATVSISYKVFDLNDSRTTSSTGAVAFAKLTGIGDPNAANQGSLGFADRNNTTFIQDTMGIETDERTKICVAAVTYSMPVAYEGITPVKEVFEFAFKREVQGLEETAPNVEDEQWSYNTEDMTGGGVSGAVTTPTSGYIYYYVVR